MFGIQQFKKRALAHIILAAIPPLAVLIFAVCLFLHSTGVISRQMFEAFFFWLFIIFVPAAIMNAVLTLVSLIGVLRQRPKAGGVIYRRGVLEALLTQDDMRRASPPRGLD